jgi:outer membrane protein assembly factor BamB
MDTTDSRRETREVVALSAENGTVNWRYKTERSVDHFTALTVNDGVYLARSGAQDGNGLVTLNMDGTERWTQETAVGHQRPHVANDTVYVSRDSGIIQAFDVNSGDRHWKYVVQDRRTNPRIVDVIDTIVVEMDSTVLGLDRTTGTVRWEFETGDQLILDTRVLDGITYVVTDDRVAAVSDGAEQWSTVFDNTVGTETRIVGTTSDRVFIFTESDPTSSFRLRAFDVANGELLWTSEAIQGREEWDPRSTIFGEVAYLGGEKLRAIDVTTGDELWQASVGDGPINTLAIIDDGDMADHTVFVYGGETQLATFNSNGEQTWSLSVDAPNWAYPVGEYVFTGTENAIFGLNRLEDS